MRCTFHPPPSNRRCILPVCRTPAGEQQALTLPTDARTPDVRLEAEVHATSADLALIELIVSSGQTLVAGNEFYLEGQIVQQQPREVPPAVSHTLRHIYGCWQAGSLLPPAVRRTEYLSRPSTDTMSPGWPNPHSLPGLFVLLVIFLLNESVHFLVEQLSLAFGSLFFHEVAYRVTYKASDDQTRR